MLITNDVFLAFLRCETKAHLLYKSEVGVQNEFIEWQEHSLEAYKQQCTTLLRTSRAVEVSFVGSLPLHELEKCVYQLVLDCSLEVNNQTSTHALDRILDPNKSHYLYIPIRFVLDEKITKYHKLLLAFDALVLTTATGSEPRYGVIIHGHDQRRMKVSLATLIKKARTTIERIATQITEDISLKPILNKHCPECDFQGHCRQRAIKNDDLSLLAGVTTTERRRYHDKGIFTVTQLSYTFHPSRRRKQTNKLSTESAHALRARAIRERKVHLAGVPKLNLQPNLVYWDVEGTPDRDTYYLVGLRVKHGDGYIQHAIWADTSADEETMWTDCLAILMAIDHPQLIYYGSYETTFLKRMETRYCATSEHKQFADQLLVESINIHSIIATHVYFPTFSNGLKDIARYLGFQWSHPDSSGLSTLAWRAEWESSHDNMLKQRLLTYNMEDCEAVEHVTMAIVKLIQQLAGPESSDSSNMVPVDSLQPNDTHRFQVNKFVLPEFDLINQAAYWDYQRDKVYLRSKPRPKYVAKKKPKGRVNLLPANKVVVCPSPQHCPKCQSTQIVRGARRYKVMYDMKFGHGSVNGGL